MNEITQWSAIQTAQKIADRSVSVTETVKAHLARAEEINPDINAWDHHVTPGGSSGGAAASVALGVLSLTYWAYLQWPCPLICMREYR
jgi:Asp-tRNA(Asn)/Glu-tRNA(Gln) amidotransferase A subunit family amidase